PRRAPAGPRPACGAAPGLAEVLDLLGLEPGAGALGPRQRPADAGGDLEVLEEVRRRRVRLLRLGDAEVEPLVDQAPPRQVVPVDEGHRGARVAGPAGAADPV